MREADPPRAPSGDSPADEGTTRSPRWLARVRVQVNRPVRGLPAWQLVVWAFALGCAIVPLWVTRALPMVDLPQHLHLISVLHRLHDPSTLYPEVFARRPELTPYLGYYYCVSALAWLMPVTLANQVFLSAYVVGLPLSLAFLLRSLRRPAWPALLAIPFAYGDSFAWGFVNYCASLPIALAVLGLFVRSIEDAPRRMRWSVLLGVSLVAVLLFHVQSFAFLAFALPLLLVTTPAPEGNRGPARVRARMHALLGVSPAVIMFLAWALVRSRHPTEIAPGEPWKAWGPMWSDQNLARKSFDQNLSDLLVWNGSGGSLLDRLHYPVLGNITNDASDRHAVTLAFALTLVAAVLPWIVGRERLEGMVARWRLVMLTALAFALFFLLPFDIRGYMYYLNTRYAHLACALLVGCVPPLAMRARPYALVVAASVAVVTMLPLRKAFAAFGKEESSLELLATTAGEKPKVMGLVYNAGSRAVRYPVYLHAACVIAREKGGLTNFSFASTPHSPLMYTVDLPPTFPSEWHPEQMRWAEQGSYYDHFLLRARRPHQQFGGLMDTELEEVAAVDGFYLVRKRRHEP